MEGSGGGRGEEEGGSGFHRPLEQETPEVSGETVSREETGRERRKKKRLRNEPQSVSGKLTAHAQMTMYLCMIC